MLKIELEARIARAIAERLADLVEQTPGNFAIGAAARDAREDAEWAAERYFNATGKEISLQPEPFPAASMPVLQQVMVEHSPQQFWPDAAPIPVVEPVRVACSNKLPGLDG